jgi:hypothetical protein
VNHRIRSLIGVPVVVAAVMCLVARPARSAGVPGVPPRVAVYLKTYHSTYSDATLEFLDQSLVAPGYITYTVVTTLTQPVLAESTALVIDESCDESLNSSESLLIHQYVLGGGRLGLFAWPGFYYTGSGLNPAAYQGLADLFGHAIVGDAVESDAIPSPASYNQPYSITGQTLSTYDGAPFYPITSTQTTVWLYSTPSHLPAAVSSQHGLFVSNSIGDEIEDGDSSQAYANFVADAIVWLVRGMPPMYPVYIPVVRRG